MDKDWFDDEKVHDEDTTRPTQYTPSTAAVPHWADPKPTWSMSDEEFFKSQVGGQLLLLHERHTRKKAKPVMVEHLLDWINGHRELNAFTQEQLAFAESEVRRLRLEGKLQSNFSDFSGKVLPAATYREFRLANPLKAKTPPPPPFPPPEDDFPF